MTLPWIPESLETLRDSVTAGILVEGHHVDFKREVGSRPADNKSLAKDLAAFAIDGGCIYIGVEEHDGTMPTLRPVELSGLKERIDQIARSSVTPPLPVRCVEIPSPADPSRGCLVVVVPPSPDAPHQAADRLWGRGDTTNHVLAPAQVRALHEAQARRRDDIHRLLDEEIDRDPTGPDLRDQGHLFVVAQPDSHDPELFHRAMTGQNFSTWLHTTVYPRFGPSGWAPDLAGLSNYSRRATGWAVGDYCISPERHVRDNGNIPARESHLVDVEIREDGGIRLFCGRGTDLDGKDVRVLLEAVVAGLVHRVVATVGAVADTAQFLGTWHFAVGLTNIRGAVSHNGRQDFRRNVSGYSEDSYRRAASATYEQLTSDPADVTAQLVGALLRGLQSPFDVNTLKP